MAIEKKEMNIAKECDDVLILINKIVETIKNKGDYTILVADLVNALNGINEIPEEAKNFQAVGTVIGHRTGELLEILLSKEVIE